MTSIKIGIRIGPLDELHLGSSPLIVQPEAQAGFIVLPPNFLIIDLVGTRRLGMHDDPDLLVHSIPNALVASTTSACPDMKAF